MLLEIWLAFFAFAVLVVLASFYFTGQDEWFAISPILSLLAAVLFGGLAVSAAKIEIPVGEHIWNTTAIVWVQDTIVYTDTALMDVSYGLAILFFGWALVTYLVRPIERLKEGLERGRR